MTSTDTLDRINLHDLKIHVLGDTPQVQEGETATAQIGAKTKMGIGNVTVAATTINSTNSGSSSGVDPEWAKRHLNNGRLQNFRPDEF